MTRLDVHYCQRPRLHRLCQAATLCSRVPEGCCHGEHLRLGVRDANHGCLIVRLQLFEVVVFTASQQVYADGIVDWLDPRRKLIQYARVLSPQPAVLTGVGAAIACFGSTAPTCRVSTLRTSAHWGALCHALSLLTTPRKCLHSRYGSGKGRGRTPAAVSPSGIRS